MSTVNRWRTGAQTTHSWSAEAKLAYWSESMPSGCIEWRGTTNRSGYGRLLYEGRMLLAHRLAFWMATGKPPTQHVLHKCDNPACINPAHLWEGTDKNNHADCFAKGRWKMPRISRGEAAYQAKLTAEQVAAIRADSRAQRAIAAAYGMSQTAIGKIKRRENWA